MFPTGIAFTAEPGKTTTVAGRSFTAVHYPINKVPCPDCGACALKLGFENGELCPMCKKGALTVEFIEY